MRITRLAAGAVAVTILLAGCSDQDNKAVPPPSPSPTPTTPSVQPPLSVAQYKTLLAGVERSIRPLLNQAMSATTLAAADAARVRLAAGLEGQSKALEQVTPPAALVSQHRSVEYVMRSSTSLRETLNTAMLEKTNDCGLPKPLNLLLYEAKRDIYYTVGGSSLNQLTKDLAKVKISFGPGLMPKPPERPATADRRGANGKVIQRSGSRGSGRLQITNDDYPDVVVAVVTGDPKKPQASIYVRGNSKATLSGLRGTYSVYLKFGTDWDAAKRRFTDNCSYERFLQFFDQRSNWRISLAKKVTGNALTNEVPAF